MTPFAARVFFMLARRGPTLELCWLERLLPSMVTTGHTAVQGEQHLSQQRGWRQRGVTSQQSRRVLPLERVEAARFVTGLIVDRGIRKMRRNQGGTQTWFLKKPVRFRGAPSAAQRLTLLLLLPKGSTTLLKR